MENLPLNIYNKISAVMAEIGPIAKDRKNTQQGYSFRGIDDLMNAFAPIVSKHGIFPTTLNIEGVLSEPVMSKSGGAGTHLIRRFTFRFYAGDGSYVDTMADGEAIDYGDKASNKAYSVAYREAIFKMFVIPFESEDIEAADHDLKPSQSRQAPPPATKRAQTKKDPAIERAAAKDRILNLLKLHEMPHTTKIDCEVSVLELTGMKLEEANYQEIAEKLSAKLDAKK